MRLGFLLFALCFLAPSLSQAARRTSNAKHNSIYVQGTVGKTLLTDSDNAPLFNEKEDKINSTSYSALLGYRFRYFCLELGYVGLGTTGYEYDEYKEEHEASMLSAGVRWIWGWFDLKLGAGTVKDKTTFTKTSGAGTFTADPNNKTTNSVGGYFGIGLNFDLWGTTELIFDYTGYSWTIDEEQNIDYGSSSNSSSDTKQGMAVLSVGLRTFF